MNRAEEVLHQTVLSLLRGGASVATVAEALMSEKIKLMQTDEYMQAVSDSRRAPG